VTWAGPLTKQAHQRKKSTPCGRISKAARLISQLAPSSWFIHAPDWPQADWYQASRFVRLGIQKQLHTRHECLQNVHHANCIETSMTYCKMRKLEILKRAPSSRALAQLNVVAKHIANDISSTGEANQWARFACGWLRQQINAASWDLALDVYHILHLARYESWNLVCRPTKPALYHHCSLFFFFTERLRPFVF
jgi:hypothetical protein